MTDKKGPKEKAQAEDSNEISSKKSKKGIVIGTGILVLAITAIVFFFVGNNMNSPDNKIAAFQEAVENNEVEALQDLLTTTDENFEINEENASELLTYFNENPELLDDLESKFNEQINADQVQTDHFATIDLVSDGKKMLFFDDYQFNVTPAYLHPMAELESVEFYINEELAEDVAAYSEEKGYGPLMPGLYQLDAVFDNSYVSLEDSSEVDLYDSSVEEMVHSFDFPVEEITVHSDYKEYTLYVNGEETDIEINEGEQPIGEFPNDGTVSLSIGKDFPWGEVRSEEVKITDEDEIEFHIEHALNKEARTALMEQLNTIVANYQEALTKKDASILDEGVTDELIEDLEENIEEIKEDNEDYEGSLVASTYDKNNFSDPEFDEDLDTYKITLRALHVFHEPNGNLGWMFRDTDEDEYTRAREMTVLFNEENGEWELHEMDSKHFVISTSDQVEFEL